MGQVVRWIGGMALFACAAFAQAAQLRAFHILVSPEGTRVVFELDAPTPHEVFTLADPDRVVIDFGSTRRATNLKLDQASGAIRDVRWAARGDGGLRVVLDLDGPAKPESFELPAADGYGDRLIVDLGGRKPLSAPALVTAAADSTSQTQATLAAASVPGASATPPTTAKVSPAPAAKEDAVPLAPKPVVVAIDAGHGGDDPGAIGRAGVQEKDVTLAIARCLAQRVDAQPGMRAVLTRDGDYYVGLRQRTEIARRAQADLFLSIHANSYKDRSMHGTAVYVLSEHGASTEQARWLANRENAADLVGGVDLQDKSQNVAAVLLDISQSATMDASFDLANRILRAVRKVNPLQKPFTQQAGFMVLKSPDIPSVLVETDFITNPRQERLLATPAYQDRLASALFEGIEGYFQRYRPLQPVPTQVAGTARRAPGGKAIPVRLTRAEAGD
jgi:N-acetylmuramoyl-L-alanine amidase